MRILEHLAGPPVPALHGEGILLRMPRRSDYAAWRDLRGESRNFLKPWETL